MGVEERVKMIQERIHQTMKKMGRSDSVLLIAAVKGRSTEDIRKAIRAGVCHIGENIIQEVERHQEGLEGAEGVVWHFIGRIQSNKIPKLLRRIQWIQTLDSFSHALEIEKRLAEENRTLPVLVEVNMGAEATKGGMPPEQVKKLVEEVGKTCSHIRIEGLMAIPPFPVIAEDSRPFFTRLRQLRDSLKTENPLLSHLSMGMSQDFLVAIEEGATMIRLGRILFEKEAFEQWAC